MLDLVKLDLLGRKSILLLLFDALLLRLELLQVLLFEPSHFLFNQGLHLLLIVERVEIRLLLLSLLHQCIVLTVRLLLVHQLPLLNLSLFCVFFRQVVLEVSSLLFELVLQFLDALALDLLKCLAALFELAVFRLLDQQVLVLLLFVSLLEKIALHANLLLLLLLTLIHFALDRTEHWLDRII